MVCILLAAVDSAGNVPESAALRAVAEWLKRGQCGHQEFEADWLKLAVLGRPREIGDEPKLLKDTPLSELVTLVVRTQRGVHYIGKSAL